MKKIIIIFSISLILICTTNAKIVSAVNIPDNIKPIKAIFDGNNDFFILDVNGEVYSIDSDGNFKTKLQFSHATYEINTIIDLAFSAGWIYLIDLLGEAIYITDKKLRTPTRVPLEITGRTIRPNKISVSPDGKMMLYEKERNILYIFNDWKDRNPIEITIQISDGDVELSNIIFDRIEGHYTVILGNEIRVYSVFGALINTVHEFIESPISAFSLQNSFTVIGSNQAIVIDEESNIERTTYSSTIKSATQDISGRAVLLIGNKILRVDSIWDIE